MSFLRKKVAPPPPPPPAFTKNSAFSLAVPALGIVAYVLSKLFLPKTTKASERYTFIWLAFDGLTHFLIEGPFLYLSLLGEGVHESQGLIADMWKEYAKADLRWAWAEPTVVSLEVLTVLGAGPLCMYILAKMVKNDPARHYWIVVLSVAELYGGWMTFCPEWLSGSKNLNTSNFLYLWVYLVFMNVIWVIIPLWLLVDSYKKIASSLRLAQRMSKEKTG